MAPGAIIDQAEHAATLRRENHDAPRDIFPDGIRTSGQHPPVYDQLKPFSEFPTEISGETVWRKEDYENNPEKWIHPFTDEEVQELSDTADRFIEQKIPLTGISKVKHALLCFFVIPGPKYIPQPRKKRKTILTKHNSFRTTSLYLT